MDNLNPDESNPGDSIQDSKLQPVGAAESLETSFLAREEAQLGQVVQFVKDKIDQQPICYEVDLQIAPSHSTQDWRITLQNRIEPLQSIAKKLDIDGKSLIEEASRYSADEKLAAIALIELKGAVKGYLGVMQSVLEVPDKKHLESSQKWYEKYRGVSKGCQEQALKLKTARDAFLVASAGIPT